MRSGEADWERGGGSNNAPLPAIGGKKMAIKARKKSAQDMIVRWMLKRELRGVVVNTTTRASRLS